jgi:hypothetical protein
MGHFRQPVFGVLDAATAGNVIGPRRIRFPERRFIHPIGFAQHPFGKPESFEHLDRPAGYAIGLTDLQRAGFLVDDAGRYIPEGRQLRGKGQSRRAAPNDQHVHLRRGCGGMVWAGGCRDIRAARAKSVQVVLHLAPPVSKCTYHNGSFMAASIW